MFKDYYKIVILITLKCTVIDNLIDIDNIM